MRWLGIVLLLAGGLTAAPSPEQTPDEQAAPLITTAERYESLGQLTEATRQLQQAAALIPGEARVWEGLRRVSVAAGEREPLIEALDHLTRLYLSEPATTGLGKQRLGELQLLSPEHPTVQENAGLLESKEGRESPGWLRAMSAVGIFVILGIAWLLSNNRRRVAWRVVAWGLGLQLTFALLILKTPVGRIVFDELKTIITKILGFTDEGAHFIFGKLYETIPLAGTQGTLAMRNTESGDIVSVGVVFAIHVIPTIIFFSSLMAVLYHLGIMQRLVRGVAWLMTRTMRTSGSESLSAAANIFVGQTEAPLVVRPYIGSMTRSEIMAIMCGGFATVAGGVLAAYVRFGVDPGHLMAASAMSAPAALMIAKILYPETEESPTMGRVKMNVQKESSNLIDAAASGAASGLKLALNVLAMILAFIALLAMINWLLGLVGGLFNLPISIGGIFGYVFAPLAFFMGVDPSDILPFGNLLGTKIAVNEFVAYIQLSELKGTISERSYTIATYALCGFANFGSIAIQIGGISGIAPERRSDLAALGLKAMFGGALASFLTATIAGLLL